MYTLSNGIHTTVAQNDPNHLLPLLLLLLLLLCHAPNKVRKVVDLNAVGIVPNTSLIDSNGNLRNQILMNVSIMQASDPI